jgi:hypothetical protein
MNKTVRRAYVRASHQGFLDPTTLNLSTKPLNHRYLLLSYSIPLYVSQYWVATATLFDIPSSFMLRKAQIFHAIAAASVEHDAEVASALTRYYFTLHVKTAPIQRSPP